ncbi:hypothetical protein GCM10028814_07730 [Angustibacter aerolatus]
MPPTGPARRTGTLLAGGPALRWFPRSAEHQAQVLATGPAVLAFVGDDDQDAGYRRDLQVVAGWRPQVPVYEVDPGTRPSLAAAHHVRRTPTTVVYRDGLPMRRVVGPVDPVALDELLAEVESADMLEEMLAWCDDVLEHGGVELSPTFLP